MREAVLFDGVFERARHVRLPNEIVERLRPILSRENLITHAPILIGETREESLALKSWTLHGEHRTFSLA